MISRLSFLVVALLLPVIGFSQWALHLDSTFGSAGIVPYAAYDLALVAGNGILACDGSNIRSYQSSGAPDVSFGNGGVVADVGTNAALEVQTDGKIVTVGYLGMGAQAFVARHLATGGLDLGFGTGGWTGLDAGLYNDYFSELTVLGDGKILAAGVSVIASPPSTSHGILICRFNGDGSLDSSFGIGGMMVHYFGVDAWLGDMDVQSDGKILLTGTLFRANDSLPQLFLARLEASGALDMSFAGTGLFVPSIPGALGGSGSATALLPNGSMVVVGGFKGPTLFDERALMGRFLSNGTVDPSFGSGGYALDPICAVARRESFDEVILQADGKLLVGGDMQRGCGQAPVYDLSVSLLRFLDDGSLDPSFEKQSLSIHAIWGDVLPVSMLMQPDGKVLMGANFTETFEMDPDEYDFKTVRFIPDTVVVSGVDVVDFGFVVYPNPVVENGFRVRGNPGLAGRLTLELFDVNGRMVQSFLEGGTVQGLNQGLFELDGALPAGVFVLRLSNGVVARSMRLVKM